MTGWTVQIGDDPLNLVAAMDCFTVLIGVQSALMATGTPQGRALDLAGEAWEAVENGRSTWSTQMANGVALKVYRMPVYRTTGIKNGEGKS